MNQILRMKATRLVALAMALVFSCLCVAPERAEASAKHVVLGGLAGAGIVLAWPTIVAGAGAICGGIGPVVAGVTGAVAAGGAMVGGAVAGVGAAAGTAVTGAFGAIGGAIAAVTASPLFVPALIAIAAVVVGVLIYRAIKKKNEHKPVRISDTPMNTPPSVSDGKSGKNTPPVAVSDGKDGKDSKGGSKGSSGTSVGTVDAREAHERYQAAYRRYIECLQKDDSGSQPATQQALAELRSSEESYRRLMNSSK